MIWQNIISSLGIISAPDVGQDLPVLRCVGALDAGCSVIVVKIASYLIGLSTNCIVVGWQNSDQYS